VTRIRIGENDYVIADEQWEESVRLGQIPPSAWILSPVWTQGVWRLADSLEVYHLFIPSRSPLHARPAPSVLDVIFPKRGLSLTETLILVNLLVTAALYLVWRDDYSARLWWLSQFLRRFVGDGRNFWAAGLAVFLHANPQHVFMNMVGLAAAGSVVEYFYGRWKMIVCYLMAGYGGAALSIALRDKPLLSVGASGAIFGLYGLVLLFVLRHMSRFTPQQRWKSARIYVPILVLAIVPSFAGERVDFYAHLGGFLTGCTIGLFLPPGPRIETITPPPTRADGPAT
jgi:membrane associated rhomboid family serine protease